MEEDAIDTGGVQTSELDRIAGAEAQVQAQGPGAETTEIALTIWDQVQSFLEGLLRPWAAYQVIIAVVLLLLALGLTHLVKPRFYDWLKTRDGWPKWRYRYAMTTHRHMALIVFNLLIWFAVWVMGSLTWPSRSYLLVALANLALAWLVVVVVLRVVQNTSLRRVMRYGAWIWITLVLTGLRDDAVQLMDSLALEFGATRISLWMIAQALVMMGLTFALARLFSRLSSSRIKRSEDISPSMQVLFIKVLQAVLYGAAFFIGLRIVGFDLRGLAFLTGFIGVGLGFGLQKVVSNLVSGVIILMDKSIKPGDVISLGETFGWINALGARYVSVVTRDGKEFLIPNEDMITNQVVNWSHSNKYVRLDIFFGTSYGNDPHLVRKIAVEAAQTVERVLSYPKAPVCHITGFGDSSVDYILRFWIEDPTGGLTNIRGNVYLALWDVFKAHDISVPFPQREVRLLSDDATPPQS
ncbi:MAG: mechanosensitive ion channel family protein [Shimia sp.]|uniref:mechanosensitive ion channel family protein n=1 Tax=Shimia sp. TaxID=1954381 RepID=UPI004057FC1B